MAIHARIFIRRVVVDRASDRRLHDSRPLQARPPRRGSCIRVGRTNRFVAVRRLFGFRAIERLRLAPVYPDDGGNQGRFDVLGIRDVQSAGRRPVAVATDVAGTPVVYHRRRVFAYDLVSRVLRAQRSRPRAIVLAGDLADRRRDRSSRAAVRLRLSGSILERASGEPAFLSVAVFFKGRRNKQSASKVGARTEVPALSTLGPPIQAPPLAPADVVEAAPEHAAR
jgi:hypothetical protein